MPLYILFSERQRDTERGETDKERKRQRERERDNEVGGKNAEKIQYSLQNNSILHLSFSP